jgi:hypothetical protein
LAVFRGRARPVWFVAVVGVLLAACGSSPSPTAPTSKGAGAATPIVSQADCGAKAAPQKGVATIPVTVSAATGGKLVTVAVCAGTNGPYTFVVDTGSPKSAIDSSVAAALNLHAAGSTALGGAGCATTGNFVNVPTLHAGQMVIKPQTMVVASLKDWSGRSVDGVIGSDVLGRFQAFKLDLVNQALTVPGPEGLAPSTHGIVIGQPGSSPPPSLVSGAPVADVPLTVVTGPGTYGVFANMTVAGQSPYSFVIDTGAPSSTIDTTAGFTLKLSNHGKGPAPAGIGCSGSVTTLAPAPVSIGSVSQNLVLRSTHVVGAQRLGIIGFLGLDFLGKTGAVVIDYAGAEMAFLHG